MLESIGYDVPEQGYGEFVAGIERARQMRALLDRISALLPMRSLAFSFDLGISSSDPGKSPTSTEPSRSKGDGWAVKMLMFSAQSVFLQRSPQ